MDEGVQKLAEVVTRSLWIFGGAQAVLVALAAWLGRVWVGRVLEQERRRTEELRAALARERSENTERLRHELRAVESMTAAARDAFAFGSQASHERRLQGVEALWTGVLRLRVSMNPLIAFYDALAPGEHEVVLRDPERRKKMLGDIGWKALADMGESTVQVELGQPFVGEKLWHLFFVYRLVLICSYKAAVDTFGGGSRS